MCLQEFPFAWWYKCILLHGRVVDTISGEGIVHCSQWNEDSISEDDMVNVEDLFSDADVRGKLLRINGGVTSDVLSKALGDFKDVLKYAFSNFTATGLVTDEQVCIIGR